MHGDWVGIVELSVDAAFLFDIYLNFRWANRGPSSSFEWVSFPIADRMPKHKPGAAGDVSAYPVGNFPRTGAMEACASGSTLYRRTSPCTSSAQETALLPRAASFHIPHLRTPIPVSRLLGSGTGVSLTPDARHCLATLNAVCLAPRTAYYDSKGHLVTERWRIARHYAKTWFVLDVICVIPYDIITAGTMGFLSMLKVGSTSKGLCCARGQDRHCTVLSTLSPDAHHLSDFAQHVDRRTPARSAAVRLTPAAARGLNEPRLFHVPAPVRPSAAPRDARWQADPYDPDVPPAAGHPPAAHPGAPGGVHRQGRAHGAAGGSWGGGAVCCQLRRATGQGRAHP